MSAAKPLEVRTFRGRCRHCGSKWIVVCYGHVPPRAVVVADIELECPANANRPIPYGIVACETKNEETREAGSERDDDDGIPF